MAISKSSREARPEFGLQLRDARHSRGWSQRELASRSGLPQSQISKIETGEVDPQVSTLVELARSLELDVQLVPRGAVGAVEVAVREANARQDRRSLGERLDELGTVIGDVIRAQPAMREAAELQKSLTALRQEADALDSETARYGLNEAVTRLKELWKAGPVPLRAVADIRRIIDGLRVAHQRAPDRPRPAYTLDDEIDA